MALRSVMASMRQARDVLVTVAMLAATCMIAGLGGCGNAGAAASVLSREEVTAPDVAAIGDAGDDAGDSAADGIAAMVEAALAGIDELDDGDVGSASAMIATSGFTLDVTSQTQLEQELAVFSSYGYDAAFVLVDMTSGRTLAAEYDALRYPASSIKGAYVLSLAASGAIDLDAVYQSTDVTGGAVRQLIDQAISVSDNDSYATLYEMYGASPFVQWAADAGATSDLTVGAYPYLSAGDLARLWVQGYGYLFADAADDAGDADDADGTADGAGGAVDAADGTDSADGADAGATTESRAWLAGEFSDTLNSSIGMALGDTCAVYTKAGWINGEGGYYALNDAGIVAAESGDYVLAVMTDACGEYGLLIDLIAMLDSIHTSAMAA